MKDEAEDKQLPLPTGGLSKLVLSSAIVSINSSVKEEMKKPRNKRAQYLMTCSAIPCGEKSRRTWRHCNH